MNPLDFVLIIWKEIQEKNRLWKTKLKNILNWLDGLKATEVSSLLVTIFGDKKHMGDNLKNGFLFRWNAIILWNDLFLLRRRMLQNIKQAIRMGKEIFLPPGKSEPHWKWNGWYTQKNYLRRLFEWNIKWNDESIFFSTLYHLYQFIICNLLSYCSSIHSCTTSETTKIKF